MAARSSGIAAASDGRSQSLLLRHPALVAIEAPHSVLGPRLYDSRNLAELSGPNRTLGGGARHQHFTAWHSHLKVRKEVQTLADHANQTIGELRQYAALDFRRERHRDSTESLRAGR